MAVQEFIDLNLLREQSPTRSTVKKLKPSRHS